MRLRWQAQIVCRYVRSAALGFLLDGLNFNGKIRTAIFAHVTTYAKLWPFRKHLAVLECKDLFWTKSDTNPTTLAVFFADDMKIAFFLFSHTLTRCSCMPRAAYTGRLTISLEEKILGKGFRYASKRLKVAALASFYTKKPILSKKSSYTGHGRCNQGRWPGPTSDFQSDALYYNAKEMAWRLIQCRNS